MIDKSQMKSYAGGVSGGVGVIAGAVLPDDLAVVIAWLIGLTGAEVSAEVARPLARFILVVGGFLGGRFITYWFPPNEMSAGQYVQAMRERATKENLGSGEE